jgi:hypothetical protein
MRTPRWVLFRTVGIVAGFLIGCGTSGTPTQPASATQVFSAPPSAIEYARTGGFAGFNDKLTIDAKGHVVLTRRSGKSEFDLDDAALQKIYAAFQTANWATIPENSMGLGVPPDGFSYTVSYQGHTVKTADAAVPRAMQVLLDALNQIINSAK